MYREQSNSNANYVVVSEGSDRCLNVFISAGSRAGDMTQALTSQALYSF